MNAILFDVGIPGGTTALIAGIGLFFIIVAAAYVLFRLMRKTVRVAFRTAMVMTFLFVLVVGGIAAYWFGSGVSSPRPRPSPTRQR